MDKNLINIDDLVRQRLTGGEERERPGAWLRMSELLEKEMPRVRPAGFIWRRMFGVLAVLALVGGVSIGGYELNAYRQLHNEDGSTTVAAVSPAPSANAKTDANNEANNTELTTAANNTANRQENNTNDNHTTDNHNNNGSNNNRTSAIAANTGSHKAVKHTSATAGNNEVKHPTANANNSTVASNTTNTTGKHNVSANADKTTANNNDNNNNDVAANTTAVVKEKTASVATANNKPAHKAVKKGQPAQAKDKQSEATNNTTDVAANNNLANNAVAGSDNSNTENKTANTDNTSNTPATGNEATTGTRSAKKGSSKHIAAANTNSDKPVAANQHKPANKNSNKGNKTTTVKDLALGSKAPATKAPGKTTVPEANTALPKGVATKKNHSNRKPAFDPNASAPHDLGAVSVTGAKNRKTPGTTNTTGKTPAIAAKGKPAGTGNNKQEDISAINRRKGKRVIEKMVVYQRSIKTSINETSNWLDTVSIENVTEEYDIADPVKLAQKNNGIVTGNEVASSIDPNADSSPFRPGSSEKTSSDMKENNFEKKTKGAKALEGLNAAFNDVKYKVGHAQFQTGIVAGVNGTFFGPNSFKGFQFGLSGKFVFSEALSLMSELKYFNRINSNYSLHDDYYNYTPVSGGYSKEKVLNPYSISTLHSIEMPISLRYSQGNFNFFFGPNLVYTFAVNTGDYPLVDPTSTPVIVSTPGNDNMPKLKAGDFDSRFGVGYLFGVSYQVSPKVMIDFRDVQTFWTTANTAGSKYISTQLYKSPSFQLSIGYRLGGNKERNK